MQFYADNELEAKSSMCQLVSVTPATTIVVITIGVLSAIKNLMNHRDPS